MTLQRCLYKGTKVTTFSSWISIIISTQTCPRVKLAHGNEHTQHFYQARNHHLHLDNNNNNVVSRSRSWGMAVARGLLSFDKSTYVCGVLLMMMARALARPHTPPCRHHSY